MAEYVLGDQLLWDSSWGPDSPVVYKRAHPSSGGHVVIGPHGHEYLAGSEDLRRWNPYDLDSVE